MKDKKEKMDKKKRVLAIIALVFVLVFTVTFIIFLYNPKMGNGAVAFTALFSGVIGLGLFFAVRIMDKAKAQKSAEDAPSDGGDEDAGAQPEGEPAANESEFGAETPGAQPEGEPVAEEDTGKAE